MESMIWVIIGCGLLAIVYGIWASQSVMASSAGNERMQEIARAIQVGAGAYLKRQYTTIGMVGVVIFAIVAYFLSIPVAVGFAVGASPVGRGRLHRHARVGARQRAHGAGGQRQPCRRPCRSPSERAR